MKLLKLQISGFKSFKNTKEIYFYDGITGVVGPNGCGKSNIIDAVLWVTGQGSVSHIRGSQMEDVIFSGTDRYPPSSFAEVSIILEKEEEEKWPMDFKSLSELTITRRLKRGGETQCFINGESCLLRNVQDVFLEIGAMGFSTVEQGTVAQMVSAKPEQIRAYIDQAAGTAHFKNKKRQTQNKLNRVNQNLLRLEDILGEQKKQLRKFEKQAGQAQEYKELKNQIHNIETDSLKKKYSHTQKTLNKKTSEIQQLNEQEETCTAQLEQAQNQHHQLRENFEKTYDEIENEKPKTKLLEEKLKQYEIESQRLKTTIDSYQNSTHRSSYLSSFQEDKEKKSKNILQLKAQKQNLESGQTLLEQDLKQKLALIEKKSLEQTLMGKEQTQAQTQMQQLTEKSIQLEEFLKNLKEKQSQTQISLQSIRTQIEKKENQGKALSKKQAQAEKNYAEENKLFLDLDEEIKSIEANKNLLQDEKKSLISQCDSLNITVAQKESRKKILSLLQTHSGSQESFEWVKKEKNLVALADVLNIEPDFETAVQAVLGSFLHSFLINNAADAEEILKEMQKKSLNLVKFVLYHAKNSEPQPYNLSQKKTPPPIQPLPSFVCCLKDKVQLKPEYTHFQACFNQLFENILVVHSITSKIPQNFICVTLQGEVLKNGLFYYKGCFEGHDFSYEIEKLSEEMKSIARRKEQLTQEIDKKTTQLRGLEKHYSDLSCKQKGTHSGQYNAEKELELNKKELSFVKEELETLYQTEKSKEFELKNLEQLKDQKSQIYNQIQQQKTSTEKALSDLNQKSARHTEQREKLKEVIQNIQLKLASTKKDYYNKEEQIQTYTLSLEELSQKEKEIAAASNQYKEEIKKYNSQLADLSQKILLTQKEYQEKTNTQKHLETAYHKDTLEHKMLEQNISKLSEQLQEFSNQRHKLELEVEALSTEKKNLEEKSLELYQTDIKKSMVSDEPPPDKIALDLLPQLKEKLSRIGEVNLLALSQYNELESEHQELNSQYEDLDQSRKELEQVIEKMDRISSQKFKIAFDEVNSRFSRVFSSVFHGGKAGMVLVKDPKSGENGVEILACPPGKKLKNLKLLSGGEKSLTALSLIVSLFLVRPAPFCILDEVDAALDDTNIFRFNSLVLEMAKQCQVILITHNKYSMKECNRLYGATMEEKGITQLVSVDINNPAAVKDLPL